MQTNLNGILKDVVATRAKELAIIDYNDRQYTWRDVQLAVDDALDILIEAGLKAGDRLVLAFENSIAVPAFFFAAAQLNAATVVINSRITSAELKRIFTHSDPSVIVFCTENSDAARAHAKKFNARAVKGAFNEVAILIRTGSIPEPVFDDPSKQVAVLLYTSGTTGAPKAAMLTQSSLVAAAYASAKVRNMNSNDLCFIALPLSHIFGLVTFLAVCFSKAAMRLEAKFDVKRLFDALQKDVTYFPGVPQMHAHLFHYAKANNKPTYTRGILRIASSGGAPLDPAWKREAEEFYGLALQNGYGLTECCAGVCATNSVIGDPDTSVGYPMQDCTFKLDMQAVGAEPEKGIGEILIGGPQVMIGYFRDEKQSAKALTNDGFFRSGDLGRFDEKKRLHIVGRSKELIIRSGFNVYPVEVEAALTEHPDVIIAGVVGRSIMGNEEVLGFVKVAQNSTLNETELKTFVKDRLAPYKRPSRIIISDELPVAPTGKILKAKLISSFADKL